MNLDNVTVHISNARELIPINGNLVNFQAKFNVTSVNKEPFRAIIVSQTALDSLPEDGSLEMKHVPRGIFSGTITEGSDKKDNWYIALEADKPIEAQVSVQVAEYDPAAAADAQPPLGQVKEENKKRKGLPLWVILLIIAGVLLAGYFAYKYFFKSVPAVVAPILEAAPAPALEPPAAPVPAPEIAAPAPAAELEPLKLDFSDLPAI